MCTAVLLVWGRGLFYVLSEVQLHCVGHEIHVLRQHAEACGRWQGEHQLRILYEDSSQSERKHAIQWAPHS